MEKLNHPYAVAITVYSLAVCLPKGTDHSASWEKLTALAMRGRSNGNNQPEHLTRITRISFRLDVYLSNILFATLLSCSEPSWAFFSFPGKNGCYLWTTDPSLDNQKAATAITVDSTSYALLAAVKLGKIQWSDQIACWLTTQENYLGGFVSSQVMKNLRFPQLNYLRDILTCSSCPGHPQCFGCSCGVRADKVSLSRSEHRGRVHRPGKERCHKAGAGEGQRPCGNGPEGTEHQPKSSPLNDSTTHPLLLRRWL